ncbi:23S rRNA (adenine(2503)-C(2))-methyltransferase RlmN [Bacteroidales bacterium OttesenSCG-928-A17]|nr:23S rRNA (adenine(2503)-C(2))-methyltransferase RlmN [Bacteroidales bacterium OttesenSCG-928-A17]
MKEYLIGKTLNDLQIICKDLSMPSFAAKQLADWLYKKKVTSIDQMTNLSLTHRKILEEKYAVGRQEPLKQQKSTDGTIKYLFSSEANRFIESVFIPDKERATLCVSSQVGCKMNCLFCMTGKQGFNAQLTSAEIINQILSIPESEKLTNLVFMGMGEPLDNIDEVLKTLDILTASYGFAWSPKRITVSTIGVIPPLKRFLEESQCHLAVSLHSPFHEERMGWMPIEKKYPAEEIIALLRNYDFAHQRRLSFEYICFGGLNDDLLHAKALVRLLSGLPARVNLIKYHQIPGINLPSSLEENMIRFRDYLSEHGVTCTIRSSRGEDILAACGMLSTKENCKPQDKNVPLSSK